MRKQLNVAPVLDGTDDIVRSAFASASDPDAIEQLAHQLRPSDLELVILFVSPEADVARVTAQAARFFRPAPYVGCTTAGELTEEGYSEGQIVAIGLPRQHFCTRILAVDNLDDYKSQDLIDRLVRNRHEMVQETPKWKHEFNFLLVDGLSTKEDTLTSDMAPGMGPVPLFGGSSGDGDSFERTFIINNGIARSNAAVLVQVRTACPVQMINTDHLSPTRDRMVVTGADPARRIVTEINAEPAAREYARLLGIDPETLTTFTFAAHPVVVRVGGSHHVRSIQRVCDNGDLVFFSAIDEGVVLTLADPNDMVSHLQQEMADLCDKNPPAIVLACDCILRRQEAEEKQMTRALSQILRKHRVIGFSTYGEQVNSMHVNQTLTGVAIYPPPTE